MITSKREPEEKPRKINKKNWEKYWRLTPEEKAERRRAKYEKDGQRIKRWHKDMEKICGGPVFFKSRNEIEQMAELGRKEREWERQT